MRGIGRFSVHDLSRPAWRAGAVASAGRRKPFSTSIRRQRATARFMRALDRALAQQRGRVVPERLREGVAQIGAGDADIGQHVAVETGQHGGLAAVAARARQRLEPVRHQRQQARARRAPRCRRRSAKRGYLRSCQSPFSSRSRRQNRPAAHRNHPKSPPDSSGIAATIAPRGLISETNVFNLIDQD